MSDYQDLCKMYGRSASDPDFIDDLIDGNPYGSVHHTEHDYYYEKDIKWFRENEDKNHYELLMEQLKNVKTLLSLSVPDEAEFSFLVMLHAHIVSAIEGYLAGVFIHKVCNSVELTKKLIETNPELSKRKFSLGEFYQTKNTLEATVASYLKDLIFHDLQKIKPMYKSVLNYNFPELSWLFKAILVRHHCVHRAGYNKDNKKINVTVESINNLLESVVNLASEVDQSVNKIVL